HPAGSDCTQSIKSSTRSVKRSLLTSSRQFRSIQRQAAEYRARFAGRQLGANLLELLKEKPARTVLLLRVFRSLRFQQSFFGSYLYGTLVGRKSPPKISAKVARASAGG